MKRAVPFVGLAVGVILASGCAATLPVQYEEQVEKGEVKHIEHFRTAYSPIGHFKHSNEYLWIYSARKSHKNASEILRDHCAAEGEQDYWDGPFLLERRQFRACEGLDGTLFFYYVGGQPGGAGAIDRMIAERRKGISDEDFLQYLSGKGYKPSPRRDR